MSQKTEASQAVTSKALTEDQMIRLLACIATGEVFDIVSKADADAIRAALKAQPAPTEAAQGEDSARLDAERYRWLCEKFGVTWLPCFLEDKLERGYIEDGKVSIDAVIDRARASAETGGVKP